MKRVFQLFAVLIMCLAGSVSHATMYAPPDNNIQKMSASAKLVVFGKCVNVKQISKGMESYVQVTLRVNPDGVIINRTTEFSSLKVGDEISFKQFQGLKTPRGVARTSLPPFPFVEEKDYVVFFSEKMHIKGVYDGVFTVKDGLVTSKKFGKLFRGLTPSAGTTKALKAAGVSKDAPPPKSIELNGFKDIIKAFDRDASKGGAR